MPSTVKTRQGTAKPTGNSHTRPKTARKTARKKKIKAKTAKPPCGARTKACTCGHHRRDHAGREGVCSQCDTCAAFESRPCASNKTLPNGRCRMHGGKQPRGIASPNWKHGRWSSVMRNPDLRNRFMQALDDPTLMSLRKSMALVDAATADFLAKLKAGRGLATGDRAELRRQADTLRHLAEAESRRERNLKTSITKTAFQAFADLSLNLFHEFVRDDAGNPRLAALKVIQQRLLQAAAGIEDQDMAQDDADDADD